MSSACVILGSGPAHSASWMRIHTPSRRPGAPPPPHCKTNRGMLGTGHPHLLAAQRGVGGGDGGCRMRASACVCIQGRNNGMAAGERLSYQARKSNYHPGRHALLHCGGANKVLLFAAIKSTSATFCWSRQRRSGLSLFDPRGRN